MTGASTNTTYSPRGSCARAPSTQFVAPKFDERFEFLRDLASHDDTALGLYGFGERLQEIDDTVRRLVEHEGFGASRKNLKRLAPCFGLRRHEPREREPLSEKTRRRKRRHDGACARNGNDTVPRLAHRIHGAGARIGNGGRTRIGHQCDALPLLEQSYDLIGAVPFVVLPHRQEPHV